MLSFSNFLRFLNVIYFLYECVMIKMYHFFCNCHQRIYSESGYLYMFCEYIFYYGFNVKKLNFCYIEMKIFLTQINYYKIVYASLLILNI